MKRGERNHWNILAMDEDSQDSFFAISDDIELEECKPLEEDED